MNRLRMRPSTALSFPFVAIALAVVANREVVAHDGHAPLPSKGATVQGNQLLLSEKARTAIGVETSVVVLADLRKTVQAQCQVQLPWHQQAHVSTLLPGRIVKVLARPGDRVMKGQDLAEVESLEFETIQRDLLKAVSERTLAERLLSQREELAQANTIPAAMVTETRRKAEESAAEAEIATRKLLALGLSKAAIEKVVAMEKPMRSLAIKSPIQGEIASTEVRSGQVVARDEALFHLVDLSIVEIAGKAIESDVPEIAVGQSVKATFVSLPDKEFGGTVEHTALEVDDRTHTLAVIAHAENPGLLLKPGMSGRMSIEVLSEKQAIVCPQAAISGGPSAPFVFLERAAGRYDRRPVKLGARSGGKVEIRDGLFPGDKVVVIGTGVLTALFPPISASPVKPVERAISQAAIDRELSGLRTGGRAVRIEAMGEVEVPVQNRHFAATQVEGRISRILVHPGDDVVAGQVLAEVASLPVFELQLELLRQQAQARWLREKTGRLRALQVSQAARKVDLWQAETDLAVVEHEIDEIRAQLKSLGFDEAAIESLQAGRLDPSSPSVSGAVSIPIRAPAAGRLDHFEVTPGEVVRPSETGLAAPSLPLFEIHDRSKIWVCAHVRETQASLVRIGQVAQVTFPAIPGRTVAGKVVRISPVFDAKTHVMPIWIEAENPDGRLFANMQARIVIEAEKPGTRGVGVSN